MKRVLLPIIASLLLVILPCLLRAQSSVRPEHLLCEYLTNPEGIDESLPRLSWTLAATEPAAFGQRQTAYLIIVSSSAKQLDQNQGELWNSGWTASTTMSNIVYGGRPLESDRTYFWKACVKDESGRRSAWSAVAHWSTGLFKRAEWTAKWIGSTETLDPKATDCNVPDPWFRKTIDLTVRPARATLFVASVGYHELYVNGKKISDDVLSPCVSDHLKRARYVAYDIAAALQPGKNVIAFWLGASWSIFSSYATDDKPQAPIVIAQADIYNSKKPGGTPDGSRATPVLRIQTDDSWKTRPSPNRLLGKWTFSQMGGEIWDAAKEIPDWNLLSCDESGWKAATLYYPRLLLTAQMVEPNRLFQEIHPVSVEENSDGSFRVDMGVNFVGWTEIKCKGSQGQRVDLFFSEREKDEMTFHIHNAFIIGKTGEGVFRNHFNYSSGRWITIRGLKEKPAVTDVRGWVVRTAYPSVATFACSDSLQNWIYDRVRWNFENLSIGGYVVDCPQRERMGYGGDAHATSETGMFNYGLAAFYTKWMEDWRDVQGARSMDPLNYGGNADEGILPHTAPTYWGGGGPAWGGICITLPWLLYQQLGDERVLAKNFDLIKNWLAFLDTHTRDDLLERFGGQWDFLGDWLWPHAGEEGMNNDKPQNICFNNCYRVYNLRTAAKIARVIGRNAEASRWERQAAASSLAIHAQYYNPSDHSYSDSSMGNLAAALLAEVPPPGLRDSIMDRLAREILVVRNGHIHVGITGGAMLFKLLRSAGRDDLIYSMTSQTDYPGWGYMKANGATSLWEMWEKDLPGHSLLHSSYLYPGAWYIDGLGGIRRDPDHPGFSRFLVRVPRVSALQVSWAKATYESPAGEIRTAWRRQDGKLSLEVTVPPGTTAKVYFPSAARSGVKLSSSRARYAGAENGYLIYEVSAGRYVMEGGLAGTKTDIIAEGEQPQIAADNKGIIRIVFGQKDKIFCSTSDDKGTTFSKPVLVAQVTDMHLGMSRGPQLASSGNYSIITAMDKSGNIHWFQLNHSSKEWRNMGTVNDLKGSSPEGLMSIAADKNDNFYAVWLDTRTGDKNQIYFSSISGNAAHWSKNILVYQSPDGHVCECCKPSIAAEGSGVAIQFRNWVNGSRDLYLLQSSDKGKSFKGARKLGMGTWKLNGCPMDGGGVFIDRLNTVHTVWQREGTVYYCKPGEMETNIGKGRTCSIAGEADNTVISMQTRDTLKVVKLPQKNEITIGTGSFLKSIVLPGNKILCVWEQGNVIKFKKV